MHNPEQNTIDNMPTNEALSALLSKCQMCNLRRPYEGHNWCRPCILKWQRSPERAGRRYNGMITDPCPSLEGIIPPHYLKAELSDLPGSLVETFLALPDDKGLYLWGEPGRGKTHACCAFLRYLWTEGWDVARVSYEMLVLKIRDSFKVGSQNSELDVIGPYLDVDKLVIEDVGVGVSLGQQESDFSLRTLLVLLDHRIEQNLATFVTTNKTIEDLAWSFDQRVASRLRQACEIVEIRGADRRI